MMISKTSLNGVNAVSLPRVSAVKLPDTSVNSCGESADLSHQAQDLSVGMEALRKLPDVRADVVARAADNVRSGQVDLDPADIAARMLGSLTGKE